jgi:hypothetical protein
MRSVLRFAVGLVAALILAGSVMSAIVFAYTLAKEGIASGGDLGEWNDRLRHYTDTLIVSGDGAWRVEEASPVLKMVGALTMAILSAAGSAWLVRAFAVTLPAGRGARS